MSRWTALSCEAIDEHTPLPGPDITENPSAARPRAAQGFTLLRPTEARATAPVEDSATRFLRDLHLERGPLSREEAVTRLRTWAAEQESFHEDVKNSAAEHGMARQATFCDSWTGLPPGGCGCRVKE
ncbi:hypothetical protein [Streptomyces sp. NPDC029041]|uniref:hypothetical protein n=1 Tax=Streptomyces sp. NPDC029041 TaxID=3155727 RepID=UPI0033D0B591